MERILILVERLRPQPGMAVLIALVVITAPCIVVMMVFDLWVGLAAWLLINAAVAISVLLLHGDD